MKKYIKIWLTQNAHAFFFSLGQYIKNPINNILTTVVIGISLAFPAGFYVFLNNIQILSKDWDNVIEINIFQRSALNGLPRQAGAFRRIFIGSLEIKTNTNIVAR